MTNPLVLAAAQAAGPQLPGKESQWLATVKRIAIDLTFLEPELEEALKKVNEATKYTGILTEVNITKSTRAELIAFTGTDQPVDGLAAGHERVQTERGDTPDGAAQIELAKSLVGHRVMIYKTMEKFGQGTTARSFRLLVRLVDLGMPEPGQGPGNAQRAPQGQPQGGYQQPQTQHVQPQQQAPQQPAQQNFQQAPAQPPAPQQPAPQQPAPQQPVAQPAPQQPQAPQGQPAQGGDTVPANDGKRIVFQAANGDKQVAAQAWAYIGNPETDVQRGLLQRAIDQIPALLATANA